MLFSTSISARFFGSLALAALFAPSVVLSVSGCKKTQTDANAAPRTSATTHSAELAPPPAAPAGTIETVDVPDDRKVLVIGGAVGRPIVHLHGMCSEARPDLQAWGSTIREHGTIIALQGDAPCPNGTGGTSWSNDMASLDARIESAISAVGAAHGKELDSSRIILIGESMGASRATSLASRFPDKYRRLVLVGGPETPSSKDLGGVRVVALLAGDKEPQEKMRQGAVSLENAGITARFWELAGASHGSYGHDGARTMAEAVAFAASK